MRSLVFAALLAGCSAADPDFVCTTDEACGEQGRCELDGFCTFEDTACAGGRRFSEHSGELSNQCLAFESPCRVAGAAERVWELDLPQDAIYLEPGDVRYTNDTRAQVTGAFRRVAYCMQLDDQLAYVELDDFTGGNAIETGIPVINTYQQPVTNLRVRSNVEGVASADADAGTMEFWPHCYDEGSDGEYDTTDSTGSDTTCFYGSFQIHHGATTVIAYNHWSGGDMEADDVGIGNQPVGHPDWTFSQSAKQVTRRFLQAFVIR